MTKRNDDDITTIRLKLEECNRLVSEYERKVETIRSQFYVDAITQRVTDAPQLVVILNQAIKPLATTGFVISLIDSDVQRLQKRLGTRFRQQVESCWRDVEMRMAKVTELSGTASDGEKFAEAAIYLAVEVVKLLDLIVLPARMLRKELIGRLKGVSGEKVPTDGQLKRESRNQRIRELAEEHGTESPAEVLKLAMSDHTIKALSVKLSREIVTNVLKPR